MDSADYHPEEKKLFPPRQREIFPSRGDNLHYPPTSQAITVLLYRTFFGKLQNHKTSANLNVLTLCQLDSLPFVARLCFISVVTVARLLLSFCWHVRVCVRLLAQPNTVALCMHGRSLLCIVVPWDKKDYWLAIIHLLVLLFHFFWQIYDYANYEMTLNIGWGITITSIYLSVCLHFYPSINLYVNTHTHTCTHKYIHTYR